MTEYIVRTKLGMMGMGAAEGSTMHIMVEGYDRSFSEKIRGAVYLYVGGKVKMTPDETMELIRYLMRARAAALSEPEE